MGMNDSPNCCSESDNFLLDKSQIVNDKVEVSSGGENSFVG